MYIIGMDEVSVENKKGMVCAVSSNGYAQRNLHYFLHITLSTFWQSFSLYSMNSLLESKTYIGVLSVEGSENLVILLP